MNPLQLPCTKMHVTYCQTLYTRNKLYIVLLMFTECKDDRSILSPETRCIGSLHKDDWNLQLFFLSKTMYKLKFPKGTKRPCMQKKLSALSRIEPWDSNVEGTWQYMRPSTQGTRTLLGTRTALTHQRVFTAGVPKDHDESHVFQRARLR